MSSVHVRAYAPADREQWLRMRCALWPDLNCVDQEADAASWLSEPETGVLVADLGDGTLAGFAEVAIHTEAPGCESARIGYLEGWYVDAAHRRKGIGRALNAAAEAWARALGCTEMASDTTDEYPGSPAAHRALGYSAFENSLCFFKSL